METLTGQLGQTGTQPPTRGYNTTEPARCAGEGGCLVYCHEQVSVSHDALMFINHGTQKIRVCGLPKSAACISCCMTMICTSGLILCQIECKCLPNLEASVPDTIQAQSARLMYGECAGVYEIVNRDGRKTSFAYRLEIPQEPGEVQDELQIKKEASFTLSMKVNVVAYLNCF